MSNAGHYLKPGTRVSAPAVLFSVVIDPHIESGARNESDTFHTWAGADVCFSRLRRGKWSEVIGARCETPEALAAWMARHADPRSRNYVVTPDAAESLALGGVWDVIESGPVKWMRPGTHFRLKDLGEDPDAVSVIRRICVGQRCTILDYMRAKLRWVWLSCSQFFAADEESTAAAMSYQWDTDPYVPLPGITILRNAAERAKLWLKAFCELCDWWRANAKAPFGLTASSLSMGILRTHIKPKAISTHTNEWCHRLERDACFGGSARTWYYGDIGRPADFQTDEVEAPAPSPYGSIPGPLTQVDVRSMYPSLLRDMTFPTFLRSYREDRGADEPQAYAECAGVLARVTIETETPEYPCRVGDRILYPVGRFTTTLTGPELLRLKGDGKVLKCHAMSLYDLGSPFKEAAAVLIEMRERARAKGRPAWELLAKTMANGMAGKLAQRKGCWIERPGVAAQNGFEEWYTMSGTTGKTSRFRSIAWCVSEYVKDVTGAGPYTAAFSYLAAYGRLHMREIRDECPAQSVVSLDTDGMWILPAGHAAIRNRTREHCGHAGSLRTVGTAGAARFFGPRHYFAGGVWTLAGFARPTVTAHGTRVNDCVRFAPMAGPAGAAPRGVCVRQRSSALAIESHGVRVGADGWVTPRRRAD
jgi:hypothetical protein